MRFADAGDVQSRADLDGFRHDLRVVGVPLRGNLVELDLVVNAGAGRVVAEAVQRILTGVEAAVAELSLVLVEGFALLVLEAAAGQILVKSFICFHSFHLLENNQIPRTRTSQPIKYRNMLSAPQMAQVPTT